MNEVEGKVKLGSLLYLPYGQVKISAADTAFLSEGCGHLLLPQTSPAHYCTVQMQRFGKTALTTYPLSWKRDRQPWWSPDWKIHCSFSVSVSSLPAYVRKFLIGSLILLLWFPLLFSGQLSLTCTGSAECELLWALHRGSLLTSLICPHFHCKNSCFIHILNTVCCFGVPI